VLQLAFLKQIGLSPKGYILAAKPNFYDLNEEEQGLLLEACDARSFVGGQIDVWVFDHRVCTFDGMTNIGKLVREKLHRKCRILSGKADTTLVSEDGTRKMLIRFGSKHAVECVAIPARERLTFCLSTMVGCPGRCLFCASGRQGLKRKLTRGEMLTQYLLLAEACERYPTNVVIMGMGEPLLNYDETVAFLRILNDEKRGNLGARKITVSTIGIPEGIYHLAEEGLQLELAFSLHHPSPKARQKLIPLSRNYRFDDIMDALQFYSKKRNRKLTLEYCLLDGINDSVTCARKTAEIARRLRAKVNLIPFNEFGGSYRPPSKDMILRFQDILREAGVNATIRRQRGGDIQAACGQLALRSANPK
jgi:23S rRNA (adenine2503-C2)-methyltransferase